MTLYYITGLPAAGKDSLADFLSNFNGNRIISLSRDILIPLIKSDSFRQELEDKNKVELKGINFGRYNSQDREDLIHLAFDLNNYIYENNLNFYNFSDFIYALYGENLIIPSFRQPNQIQFANVNNLDFKTILVTSNKKTRYRRWLERDPNLSLEQISREDELENEKFMRSLIKSVTFDYAIGNNGSASDLQGNVFSQILR